MVGSEWNTFLQTTQIFSTPDLVILFVGTSWALNSYKVRYGLKPTVLWLLQCTASVLSFQFFGADWNEVCGKRQIFVPKSQNQMGEFSDEIFKSNLSVPIRIWTDFERVNKTHFWSENAESWWSYDVENESHTWGYWRMIPGLSNIRSHFVDSVLCDGNKKLSNRASNGSCICTSKYFVFFRSK